MEKRLTELRDALARAQELALEIHNQGGQTTQIYRDLQAPIRRVEQRIAYLEGLKARDAERAKAEAEKPSPFEEMAKLLQGETKASLQSIYAKIPNAPALTGNENRAGLIEAILAARAASERAEGQPAGGTNKP